MFEYIHFMSAQLFAKLRTVENFQNDTGFQTLKATGDSCIKIKNWSGFCPIILQKTKTHINVRYWLLFAAKATKLNVLKCFTLNDRKTGGTKREQVLRGYMVDSRTNLVAG